MKRFSVVSMILALVLVVFTGAAFSAQPPEPIDIQSLKIVVSQNIPAEATMTYKNSAQSTASFVGWTNYTIPFVNGGSRIPSIVNSNGFADFGIVSGAPGGNGDFRFRFYLSASESDPIVLRPTILRKRREIFVAGNTRLRGRVELIDQRTLPNKVIAVDNDFELTGNYRATFLQFHATVQRSVVFQSIVYDLNQTE